MDRNEKIINLKIIRIHRCESPDSSPEVFKLDILLNDARDLLLLFLEFCLEPFLLRGGGFNFAYFDFARVITIDTESESESDSESLALSSSTAMDTFLPSNDLSVSFASSRSEWLKYL